MILLDNYGIVIITYIVNSEMKIIDLEKYILRLQSK